MRIAVIGKSGQLARCLAETAPTEMEVAYFGRAEMDIAQPETNFAALTAYRPDLLINASAYTAVDKAESDREAAFALNEHGPARLAKFASELGIPLIHVSTDYVFDGAASRPYTEDDPTAPLNVYGESKLAGEQAVVRICPRHIIIRTSWLYSAYGHNFVKTMLRLGSEKDVLRIVADQRGRPTSTHELARVIWIIVQAIHDAPHSVPWGLYHYADAGEASWADFAEAIFAASKPQLPNVPKIERITTAEFPTPAPRPLHSVLDSTKIERAFNIQAQPWTESLKEILARIHEEATV
ncbi:MAG: dTDP-4-dehydrorhamnose reductase [Alphaproteobacteria bacterium]